MALDNYPPGFDIRALDDTWNQLREYVGDTIEVKYTLTVEVDDETVYQSDYATGDDLISDGIRKGERRVDKMLDEITNDRFEEAASKVGQ